ncbi:MAG: MATE family efflux transporter [Lachnospiraceae bacterium]|nr:MATE family efflux transporter [Lachnospiraceae bacterium]
MEGVVLNGQSEDKKENKMGVMPIGKLLLNMSLPMMISMLVQACYNVVDSVFVAKITDPSVGENAGTAAISALGMAFPFQTLLIAFGAGTCVGVNAVLSKALGEKDTHTVNKATANGIFLSACSYVLFLLIGLFLPGVLIKSQGGEGLTLLYGTQYLRIVCVFSFGLYTQFIFERLLQATGRTILTMVTQSVGALINIILDPIFIFVFKMGVAGAAYATVIGQCVAGVLAIIFNLKMNPDIKIDFHGFRPDGRMIGRIYAVGIPTIIMQSIGSVMTYLMNKLLNGINPASVAVFTVYFKLQSFFFMPLFGLNNGLVPILAYNFGAQKRSRMYEVIKKSMVVGLLLMVLGFIAFEVIPEPLLRIFDTGDPSLIILGKPALRIIGIHYLIAWFCIVGGSVYQALGNGFYSMMVSVSRQLVVLLPVAYVLGKNFGLPAIWWCFPIAELMSLLMNVIFLVRINKNVISQVADNP